MGTYHRVLTIALAAASANNICLSQSKVGAGNLTIAGAAASGGVATLDTARRVLFTFAADETGHNFTVTGTDRNGYAQTEVVAGTTAGTVNTVKDYLTVSQIAVDASTTGALTVGTSGVASSVPMIIDRFIGATNLTAAAVVTGTANYSVQVSYDDLAPEWDMTGTQPTWFAPPNTSNLTAQSTNKADVINLPITMVRLLQNSFSTGGAVSLTINVPMKFI